MRPEDIITSTAEATNIIAQFGLDIYSTVRAHLSVLLSQQDWTPEELMKEIYEDYRDLFPGELSQIIGMFLNIPYTYAGALAAVSYVEDGKIYYCAAGVMHSRIRTLRTMGKQDEVLELIALQTVGKD